jgi:hypothetical protein
MKFVGKDPKKILRQGLSEGTLDDVTAGRCKKADPQKGKSELCQFANVLEAASLNAVRIMVGGTMTVDVNNVPAKIDSIEITNTDKTPVVSWTATTTQNLIGIIHGSFLSNGQPVIVNSEQLGITNLAAATEGSTDKELHFKMSLTKAITDKKVTFKVVKKTSGGANVESATYDYPIPPPTPQNEKH